MSHVETPELLERGPNSGLGRWMVVLYNNDVHTFDQVIAVLMRATACDEEEASIEAWEAHTYGKAPVHFASETECREAAKVISGIGLVTDVCLEWED